jgi:hypothetical protein
MHFQESYGLTAQLGHINSLREFLINIRPAYLQVTPSRFRNHASLNASSSQTGHAMSEKERDEMDFEAKSIIRQANKKIKILEAKEAGTDTLYSKLRKNDGQSQRKDFLSLYSPRLMNERWSLRPIERLSPGT